MPGLYAVTLECELVCWAESLSAAEQQAAGFVSEVGRYEFGPSFAHEIKTEADLPSSDWLDSLPYGGDGRRTVRQILASPEEGSGAEGAVRDSWTLDLFAEDGRAHR